MGSIYRSLKVDFILKITIWDSAKLKNIGCIPILLHDLNKLINPYCEICFENERFEILLT